MKRILFALPLLAALLAYPAPAPAGTPQKDAQFVGKPSPAFSVKSLRGREISSVGLAREARAVVLNFWGLRCAACIEEMKPLNELYGKYRDRVVMIGVNVDGVDAASLADLMKDSGISVDYDVVPDPDFKIADTFKLKAAPLTFVIDGGGIVRYQHEDYRPGDEKGIEEAIKGILESVSKVGR